MRFGRAQLCDLQLCILFVACISGVEVPFCAMFTSVFCFGQLVDLLLPRAVNSVRFSPDGAVLACGLVKPVTPEVSSDKFMTHETSASKNKHKKMDYDGPSQCVLLNGRLVVNTVLSFSCAPVCLCVCVCVFV